MKGYLLTITLLITSLAAFAQIDAAEAQDHVIVKFSPLPLFDVDNTVQFGVEVPFGKSDFSFQQDLGYGHSSFNIWYYDYENHPNKQTFKSRSQFKYYYYERTRMRAYVGMELLLKRVLYKETQWVGRECTGGTCSFFENMPVKVARRAVALHPRLGWQFYFPKRLTLDLFVGVGLRRTVVRGIGPNSGEVQRVSIDDIFTDVTFDDKEIVPSIALGVHLGIALGKFKN